MKIVQASFFWRSDAAGGLGLSLRGPEFTPKELTDMFTGHVVRQYYRDSDAHLGTDLVESYLAQLAAIASSAEHETVSLPQALLAAFNIMYLADRGFIPNDEFNGPFFVYEKS